MFALSAFGKTDRVRYNKYWIIIIMEKIWPKYFQLIAISPFEGVSVSFFGNMKISISNQLVVILNFSKNASQAKLESRSDALR